MDGKKIKKNKDREALKNFAKFAYLGLADPDLKPKTA